MSLACAIGTTRAATAAPEPPLEPPVVRALAPDPGARTRWQGEPLRVLAAATAPGPVDRAPGRVRAGDGSLHIATADGWLVPGVLQRAGGKPLEVAAFLRGRPIPDAAQLGEEGSDADGRSTPDPG
jgi:methionyl-tRNA formyltransferase